MSKTAYRRLLIILFAICMLSGLLIGIVASQVASYQSYRNIAILAGAVFSQNPGMEGKTMLALKSMDNIHYAYGSEILERYGYKAFTFYARDYSKIIWFSLLLSGVLFLLLAYILFFLRKKSTSRVDYLTDYLHTINLTGEAKILRVLQDDFSQLEDELYKTVMELKRTRESAILERKKLADNLADIAHQLKTPLTSMSLMAQLLSGRNDEDAVYIEKLQKQLERLERLVSSLLTLSRLDAGTLILEEHPVDVYAMLCRATEHVEAIVNQKKQTLCLQDDEEVFYIGDINWCVEAIINILKNCCEHTPEGGIISLSYSRNPLFTQIVVEDNGRGFDREDIPHLFKRFYKGRNADKNSIGIGLALAKSIIEKQNGSIHGENCANGGARFIIKFYASA